MDASRLKLTNRQKQVLFLAACGCTDRDIAGRLTVTERTVWGHMTRIRGRLHVPTRTAAIALALTDGLIPTPRRHQIQRSDGSM